MLSRGLLPRRGACHCLERRRRRGYFPRRRPRAAAQRCKDDGYLQVLEVGDKPVREVCALTDKGRSWLLHQSSPRQVLEDFVRVLEDRQKQADDLIAAARDMAASLDSLKASVEQMRPLVQGPAVNGQIHHVHAQSQPPTGSPSELSADILTQLAQWHTASSGDCPLPELFKRLKDAHAQLSIGVFHDELRELHERGQLYLHPWTGPLYALPEPPFALLVGHEIAYYASQRNAECGMRNAD